MTVPRSAEDRTARTTWDRLGRPLQTLVGLLMVAAVLAVYREAEGLVGHLFNVFVLFVFAAAISLLLNPVVDWVQRVPGFRNHRAVAVLVLYLGGGAILVGIGFLVGPNLAAEARQLPDLATRFEDQLARLNLPIDFHSLTHGSTIEVGTAVNAVSQVISVVAGVVFVLVISIYLLVQGRTVVATLRNVFPSHTRTFDFVGLAVGSTVAAYVRGQLIISLLIGAYTAAVMALLGVHYAIVLGIAALLLEFLPIIGAVLAMSLATAVALLQSPGLALLAAGAGVFGHAMEAYIIGPRIAGKVTQLHPLVAMAALLVGAEVGGLLGALSAVPIAAVANIFLGAVYRSRQGQEALSTHTRGHVEVENLPRLGEEIGGVEEEGIDVKPVPRRKGA